MDTKNLPAIDTLWDYDKPKVTELRFRELVPLAEKSENKSYYAELLTQFARTQSLQQNFNAAHEILDDAERIIKDGSMPVAEIRYMLERGRTFNSANKKDKSVPLFKKAFDHALKYNEDFYAIDAAHMLGIAKKPTENCIGILRQWNSPKRAVIQEQISGWDHYTIISDGPIMI